MRLFPYLRGAVLSKRDPKQIGGRYDVLNRIGRGGAGAVYRAQNRETGSIVAIKVLKESYDDNSTVQTRFAQEFQSAARLDHPNIVRVLDFGIEDNRRYLVMEYVEGKSLTDLIDSSERLPEATAVKIITQIAQALHYAHKRRIIHRDVKPDNILISGNGMAKLADFGLAKDFEHNQHLTHTASGLGTPQYMAPEQYEDAKNVGVQSDVYSLGATMYVAVTGNLPFPECTSLVALAHKLKGQSPSPRKWVKDLSVQVDEAVRRAMDPNPRRRPTSCLAFARMLPVRFRPQANPGVWTTSDRRNALRYVCNFGTECILDTGLVAGGPDSEDTWPGVISDISITGLGVILARRFELGTNLTIQLDLGAGREMERFQLEVARIQPDHYGHWLHGCQFKSPLREEQIQLLLK